MNSKILLSVVVVVAILGLISDVSGQRIGPFRLGSFGGSNLVNAFQAGIPRPVRPRGGRVSPV